MFLLKIILFSYFLKGCFCDVSNFPRNVMAPHTMLKNSPNVSKTFMKSTVDTNKKTPGFRFRLPFMDMELQNQRNVLIMQERLQKQQIYVIHGNELYQMFVGRDEKRLAFIGHLGGSVQSNEPLGAEIIDLREYLIMVIALEEHLEVYQLSEQILELRAQATKDSKRNNESTPLFEPIQQISLPGRYRQHFLLDPSNEHVMLIVGINFTKLYGRLHTFVWANSYFEPVEELTVPPIHALYIIGKYPKYLVRGRIIRHQAKTIITVAEIQSTTMTLQATQTLTVNSHTVHAGSFRGKHYLIACSSKQKQCNTFRMSSGSGQFSVYKQRASKDLAFDKFTGGQHFLVSARLNQISVYTSGRLDCYAGFKANESDVTSILALVNAHGEDFILLIYKRPFHTLIRMVELESESGGLLGAAASNGSDIEDTSALFRHRHMFEETIGALRSLLLRRRSAMHTFRKAALPISNSTKPVMLNLKQPVRIHGGEIETVKLVGQHLRSPLQLLQRVAEFRQRFGSSRSRRGASNQTKLLSVSVRNLRVRNLIYEKSILPGFHLDNAARPQPILSVRPKLTTNTMTTQKLLTRHTLRRPRESGASTNLTSPFSKLKQLNVVSINGVLWQDFYDALFLKNRDSSVKGRLILQAATHIENLETKLLNDLSVENLFNMHEPQVVDSNVLFFAFLTRNLTAESVNGLDFANDIVFQNTESFIETPVNMYQLRIEKDLLLNDNVTMPRTPSGDETEFKQHYTGKVIINGTLTVKNLSPELAERTKILIDKKPFLYEKIKQKYLLYKEPQHFNSTVIFGNAKVTVSSLETKFLNENPTEQHLLVNQASSQEQQPPLFLIFMNSRVEGDLVMANGTTRIANLSKQAVRRDDVANITGTKLFEAPLAIDHVMTLTLNEMPVSELVLKSQLQRGLRFKDTKSFDSLVVEEALIVDKALNISQLNRLPMRELLNPDYHYKRLQVPRTLEATNVVFHKINGINFDEVFGNFKPRDGELFLHKKLIVEGNLKFSKNLNVTNVNDLHWQTYQEDLVPVNENAKIAGRKCFLKDLTITNALKTDTINNLALENIFERVLSKSKAQIIKAHYVFGNVQFSNLDAPAINNVPAAEFIDMRVENITLKGDIMVPTVTVLGNVKSNDLSTQHALRTFTSQIKQLAAQRWRSIVVTGNAYWNDGGVSDKSQQELLTYIYKNAVQRTGHQVISGNVKLVRPVIGKMSTTTHFPKNFDLDWIAKDCVLRKVERTQTISAKKIFSMPIQLRSVEVSRSLSTHFVNGIDVQRFNVSLYRLSSKMPIAGPLKFREPVTIENMFVEHYLNGISPADIYSNIAEPVPPLKMRKLIVDESLQIDEVNGESLDYLLENRLAKHDTLPQEVAGYLSFQHLVLNESNVLRTVNGIPLENLVFKKSRQLQSITGTKTFGNDLLLIGPAHVMHLNDHDITDSYQQTIFKNGDYESESLAAKSATFENGLILLKNIENIEPTLGTTLTHGSTKEMALSLQTQIQMSTNELDREKGKLKNLLYLDYAPNWQILCTTPNISTHESYQLPSKRTSPCERQFQNVHISYPVNDTAFGQIFLSNFTSNLVTASAHNVRVEAENFCLHKYRKVKSKITVTAAEFKRVIGLRKYIESIFIYKPTNHSDVLLLLHEIEFAHSRHEVRILRLPRTAAQNVTDWQSLSIGIGKAVRLFSFGNYTALISGGGLIEKRPALAIYRFNATTVQFQLVQSIAGDFDVFELLPVGASTELQLLLSCNQCRQISIYTFHPHSVDSSYEIFQLIKLKTLVGIMQPFRLSDGSLFLLLFGEHHQPFYYLYRYTQLQGWLHATYGYFDNTEMVMPLNNGDLDINDPYLLALLCGSDKCQIIKAVVV